MKTLILLICVVVVNVQASAVIRELLGSSLSECKEKVNATPEDLLQLLKHKPSTTTSAKCLVTCFNKKFKIQNEKGDIDINSAKETLKLAKLISQDMYEQLIGIVDICAGQVPKGDECEIGSSFFNCVVKEVSASTIPWELGNLLI